MLYLLEELSTPMEESNAYDRRAVAVLKNDEIVGHMPRSISRLAWFFNSMARLKQL